MVVFVVAACVGDDPEADVVAANDGGASSSSGSSSSSGAGGIDSGSTDGDGGLPPQDGGADPCARIKVSTLAGTGGAGEVDGPGDTAKFNGADGITARDDGTLIVADQDGHTIRQVTSDGVVSTLYAGDTTFQPVRVAMRLGTIYLVDSRNDQIAYLSGTPLKPVEALTLGAIFALGIRPPSGPTYFGQTQNCRISTLEPGKTYKAVTGTDAFPCTDFADGDKDHARFSQNISDFAFDGTSTMYVADTGNFRIRKIDEATVATTTLAGSTQGYADGAGAAAKFQNPTGLAVDPETHIVYVADETRIRAVTKDGVVTTLAGGSSAFVDGDACVARFGKLRDITYYAGALYAVDVNRIRKIVLP